MILLVDDKMGSRRVLFVLTIICSQCIFVRAQHDVSKRPQRRCISCRSRGELGSCKDPFTMNSTQIEKEHGVEVVPCGSGWCGKVIESPNLNNEFGTATHRMCFQRGPDDGEERCAYTVKNYKTVYMCLCFGDLCNAANPSTKSPGFLVLAPLSYLTIRWWL